MSQIALILFLNAAMWYVIDNLKENIWGGHAYSRYITILVSTACAFGLSFGYNLDILYALEVVQESGMLGNVITALSMMGGSAAVSEIVEMFRGKN